MSDLMRKTLVFIFAACAITLVVGSFPGGAVAQGRETAEEENSHREEALDGAPSEEQAGSSAPRRKNVLVPQTVIDSLPPVLKTRFVGTQFWKIVALGLIASVGLVLRTIFQFIVRRRLSPVAEKFGAQAVGHVVDVIAGPGSILVVSGLLALLYPQLGLSPWLHHAMGVAVRSMAILSIVLSFYRLVDVFADRMAAKAGETDSKLDDQLVPLVRKALKVLVVLSGALFLLQNLDVNVGSLVAGLGIGGVAVALAAKDTIANFFGSLMIFIDRPFQIGDWVKVGDTEGIVEVVGFRSTRVRTFYNSLVTVPNAHFTESTIDNIGLRYYRRLKTTLGLTYDTSPEQIQAFVEGIRAIIVANPSTRKDSYEIHFNDFGAHSLDIMVYLFLKVQTWSDELRERHNILLEILRLAKELKVEFAFPTQTLHLDTVAAPGAAASPKDRPEDAELGRVVQSFGPGGARSRPGSPFLTESGYLASTVKRAGEG